MVIIEVEAKKYNPNLRFLKDYIITFDEYTLTLYDLKGNKLDSLVIGYIIDICVVNNKFILIMKRECIIPIIINKEIQKNKHILKIIPDDIYNLEIWITNCFYSKKNSLLFVDGINRIKIIKIDPINLLIEENIQTIYIKDCPLMLNMNKNFILANEDSIFLYQKINGIQKYEFKSKLSINLRKNEKFHFFFHGGTEAERNLLEFINHFKKSENRKIILKLNNKTILLTNSDSFYLINILKMKIINKYIWSKNLPEENNTIRFIKKLDNKIYFCTYNYTLVFTYLNNRLSLACKIYLTDKFVFNYFTNLYFEKCFPKSKIKFFFPFTGSKKFPAIMFLSLTLNDPKKKGFILETYRTFEKEIITLNDIIYKEQKEEFLLYFINNIEFRKLLLESEKYIREDKIKRDDKIEYIIKKKRSEFLVNSYSYSRDIKEHKKFYMRNKKVCTNKNKKIERKRLERNKKVYPEKKFKKRYR